MKKLKLIFLLLICAGTLNAQSFQMAKKGGSNSTDYGYGMCLDNAGNMYIAGCYSNTAQFDNVNVVSSGFYDIFVAKYNSTGTLLWITKAGGVGHDEADKIFLSDDGYLYFAGTFMGTAQFGSTILTSNGGPQSGEDVFLSKMTTDGAFVWTKQYGGLSQDFIHDMELNGNNLIISGQYYGTFTAPGGISLPAGNGTTAKFIMRLDTDGNPIWAKNIGGNTYVALSNTGFYVAGIFGGTANFDNVTFTSSGSADLFLGSYDFNGTQQWIKQFGGTGSELMRSLAYDKTSGNIFWAGCFQNTMVMGTSSLTSVGQMDIFVSKFDASGNNIWAKKAGGANYDVVNGTVTDAQGNVYITGYCMETAVFSPTASVISQGSGDAYIAKYNSIGDFQWVRGGGGSGQDNGMCIKTDNNSNIFVTGFFSTAANFGSIGLSGYGASDVLVLKIGDMVSIQSPREPVSSFRLNQNYPNPFNPSTKISFDIYKAGAVTLSVTDASGKEIAELVNASMNTGSYEINFNAEDLSAGVYFYKLKTESGVITKKMMLVK